MIVAFFLKIDLTRMYLLIAYPLGLGLIMIERWLLRQRLVQKRLQGYSLTRVMIISDVPTGKHLYKSLSGAVASGLSPAAFYLPGIYAGTTIADVDLPILGYSTNPDDIMQAVQENNIQMVAISNGHQLTPEQMRMLGWRLADAHIALIMAPATTDIAGPRMHIQPLNGLPLVHVSTPAYYGYRCTGETRPGCARLWTGASRAFPCFLGGGYPYQTRRRTCILLPRARRNERRCFSHGQIPVDAHRRRRDQSPAYGTERRQRGALLRW